MDDFTPIHLCCPHCGSDDIWYPEDMEGDPEYDEWFSHELTEYGGWFVCDHCDEDGDVSELALKPIDDKATGQ